MLKRRPSAGPATDGLIFKTRLGQPWVRFAIAETKADDGKAELSVKSDDAIAKATRKLVDGLGIYRASVTFYALRHTFETIVGGCKDQVAVDAVMGHVDETMAAEYREGIDDERLLAAVNHVRAWLFPKKPKEAAGAKEKSIKRQSKAKRLSVKSTPRADLEQVAEAPPLRIVG